eukprot:2456461-Amphidinium_carterae.1
MANPKNEIVQEIGEKWQKGKIGPKNLSVGSTWNLFAKQQRTSPADMFPKDPKGTAYGASVRQDRTRSDA